MLKDEVKRSTKNKDELLEKMDGVLPRSSAVRPKDVFIYEITPKGEIQLLRNYDGIPSDSNFLNSALSQTNDLFDVLLEIQDEVDG